MTETQLREKFSELMEENKKLFERKLNKAIMSGAFDLKSYENNFCSS